jgi:hypothetical protein
LAFDYLTEVLEV